MTPDQVPTEAVAAGMRRWDEIMKRAQMTTDGTSWFELLPEVYCAMAEAIKNSEINSDE